MSYVNRIQLSGELVESKFTREKGPRKFRLKQKGGKKKDGGFWPDRYFDLHTWAAKVSELLDGLLGREIEIGGRLVIDAYKTPGGEIRRSASVEVQTVAALEREGPRQLDPVQWADGALTPPPAEDDIPFSRG